MLIILVSGCSSTQKCGDGVCDEVETRNNVCPIDCSNGNVTGQTPVYVTVFSHNEEGHPVDTEEEYLEYREALLKMVDLYLEYGVSHDFEPDWKFLEAARLYEKGGVLDNTNGKNILRYLSEDLGIQVDPHSHEGFGYNYADVAYLIDELGVEPSGVVGGFIAYSDNPHLVIWEKFRMPLEASKYSYTGYAWAAESMMGAATPSHAGRDEGAERHTSGLYRPKSKEEFATHDPDANLINIGACGDFMRDGKIAEIDNLIEDIESGKAPSGKLYNANVGSFEFDILVGGDSMYQKYVSTLKALAEYEKQGKIIYVTYNELIGVWKDDYNEEPNIYPCSGD
jgi:hypothetical protein